jgi:hypothetical protein
MSACSVLANVGCHAEPSAVAAHALLLQEEWLAQVEGLWEDLIGEEGLPQILPAGTATQTRAPCTALLRCAMRAARCLLHSICLCRDLTDGASKGAMRAVPLT